MPHLAIQRYNGAGYVVTSAGGGAELYDLRHNYWGVFPDPSAILQTQVDFQCFVGVPFDATWSKGPYVGGEVLTENTTWSGTIFVTGP